MLAGRPVNLELIPRSVLIGLLLSAFCAATISACGDDQESGAPATPTATQAAGPEDGSSGSKSCQDVTVPGHKAVAIKATGAECGAAEKIAAAAEGRGRAAYESQGFACTPSEAEGGDTIYRCSMGSATVTFLYGTT